MEPMTMFESMMSAPGAEISESPLQKISFL